MIKNDFYYDLKKSNDKDDLNISILRKLFPNSVNIKKSELQDDLNGIDFFVDDKSIQVKNDTGGIPERKFIEIEAHGKSGWFIKYLESPPDYIIWVFEKEAYLIEYNDLILYLHFWQNIPLISNKYNTARGFVVNLKDIKGIKINI